MAEVKNVPKMNLAKNFVAAMFKDSDVEIYSTNEDVLTKVYNRYHEQKEGSPVKISQKFKSVTLENIEEKYGGAWEVVLFATFEELGYAYFTTIPANTDVSQQRSKLIFKKKEPMNSNNPKDNDQ